MRQIVIDFGTLELFGMDIPLRVLGYGLMLVCGFLLAVGLTRWRARRAGEDPDNISRVGIVALVAGVLGARLAYVIENWSHFARSDNVLGDVFNITSGGLIYFGGLILATAAVIVTVIVRRRPVRRYVDIVAVGVMVGLAFGRAGCLLNGCCWGARCRDDWSLSARFPMYSHPLASSPAAIPRPRVQIPKYCPRMPMAKMHAPRMPARTTPATPLAPRPTHNPVKYCCGVSISTVPAT